jgi:hypothetical protein
MGFMVDKLALEQDFSRVIRFPLPILIPLADQHIICHQGLAEGRNSGRHAKWTQCHPLPKKKKLTATGSSVSGIIMLVE